MMTEQHSNSSVPKKEEDSIEEGSSTSSSTSSTCSSPETHLVSEENPKNISFKGETIQFTPRSCCCCYILAIFLVSMVCISFDSVGDRILVARSHRSGVGQSLRGKGGTVNHDHGNNATAMTRTTTTSLVGLHWSHATNSIAKLSKAMENPYISALEVDVRMGHDISSFTTSIFDGNNNTAHGDSVTTTKKPTFRIPVLSHDPGPSDLSVQHLLDVIAPVQETKDRNRRRRLTKHIIFDFKEFSAVEPVIKLLQSLDMDQNDKMIYLNADLLPFQSSKFNADDFLSTCLNLLANTSSTVSSANDDDDTQVNTTTAGHKKNNHLSVTFSIGYVTATRSLLGFREDDLTQVSTLIKQHHVMDHSAGVLLPANARVLSRNMLPFDLFLDEFPTAQLFVWTGHGEPPISKSVLHKIQNHFFRKEGRQHRIEFDVQVASNVITGTIYDYFVDLKYYLTRLGVPCKQWKKEHALHHHKDFAGVATRV